MVRTGGAAAKASTRDSTSALRCHCVTCHLPTALPNAPTQRCCLRGIFSTALSSFRSGDFVYPGKRRPLCDFVHNCQAQGVLHNSLDSIVRAVCAALQTTGYAMGTEGCPNPPRFVHQGVGLLLRCLSTAGGTTMQRFGKKSRH